MSLSSVAKRFAGFLACAALLGASPAVAQPGPGVYLYYSPTAILQGGNAVLGLEIFDSGTAGITGGSITSGAFTYPLQVVNTGIVPTNSCGGSITASPGASTFGLSGLTVPPSGICFIEIQVTTTTAGSYLTSFPASAFSGSAGVNTSAPTATLVSNAPLLVTNTNDSGPGSLRDAITQANANCAGLLNIGFAIPGTGPFTIQPLTQLPGVACANTAIDGTTQAGFVPNSDTAGGNNSSIQIALDGSVCTGGCDGLQLQATNAVVRGLAIHSFGGSGIFVGAGSASISGNYIGTDPGGMTALGNTTSGVEISGGFVLLGSNACNAAPCANPGDRNLISANGTGVWLLASGTATIENNQIGGKRDGSSGNGNLGRGILFNSVNSSSSQVAANFVRYNSGAGIAVDAGTSGKVTFTGNSSYANGGIGIDVLDDGPTANDEAASPYDTDNVQNYPVITSVAHVGADTVVSGYLKSRGSPQSIELYHNSAATPQTEGEQLIDVFSMPLDATGFVAFTRTIVGFLADNVSAATTVDTCGDGCVRSSEYSPKVAVIGPPGAPVSATAIGGDAQATVSFSPPSSDGGSPITTYTVTSSPSGITATGAASPILVPGLVNGTPYTFTVTATNAVGTGPPSAPSNSVTPAAVPGAPTIGTATAGNAQATVAFTPPASNGGSAITSYTVTSVPGGITAFGSASPITVIGLSNGTTYTFTVTATNGVGVGPASGPSNAVTPTAPAGTPGAPTGVMATGGDAQATVAFSPPASNGGSPITSYLVTSIPGGITATGPASPITVTGLANGTSYTFTVTAINAVGPGPASLPSNAVTPLAPVPSLILTPPSLNFAARTVSTTSAAQTVTLTNIGPGTVTISSITVSGDFAFTSACPASLSLGVTCTLNVTFTPLASGLRAGALAIASNATGSPQSVALSGSGQVGLAAIIQVAPDVGEFAPQELGNTSAPQLFVITNVGNATLSFSDIVVTGAGFTLLPTVTGSTYERCGAAIQSGAVCAVQVTFNPSAAGPFEGVLHIAGNATNTPVDVRLIASGVVTAPPRALSVPSSLAFPDQPVGTQSTGRAVTITNNSASVVSISGLSVTGDFSVSDTCTTIPAHGNCAPLVAFGPTALGVRTGTLTIRTLSESIPYQVDLSGTGVFSVVPQITLSVTQLGFGNTLIGAPVTAKVILTNVGQVPVLLQSVLARAQFLASHACPFSIPVRGTCEINVGFFPSIVGPQSGVIEISTNAAGSPHDVQVSGVGCAIPSISRSRAGQPVCGP